MVRRRTIGILASFAALAAAGPAAADVKDGVDAWSRGDWNAAVAQWRGPADANDPDALFNLGQAYRLGRGVPQDDQKARDYYARAAKLGHVRAADTYGILLFQDGERKAALPYIQDAARRGDPRSEYLLGVALFNGDLLPKDWVRGYALLTLANSQGLPQAAPALAEMDKYIPLDQRQQSATLAIRLKDEADAAQARDFAAAGLAPANQPARGPAPRSAPGTRPAQPNRSADLERSVAEAREAVRQAMLVTGTENPAEAGADYARPAVAPARQQARNAPPPQAAAPVRITPQTAVPARPAPPTVSPPPRAASGAAGPWKVQLGVFSVEGNAERLWSELAGTPELAGRNCLLVPVGKLTKLLAGGYASQDAASVACERLKRAGHDCVVTR